MTRRAALQGALLCVAASSAMCITSCARHEVPDDVQAHRVLILGMDGLDPVLLKELMDAGRMPHFSQVASSGTFEPLGTSAPPQSPVAWSNFICGCDPGTHQIYDFIHRDPHPQEDEHGYGPAVSPYLSTSRVEPPEHDWSIDLGRWRIPLTSGTTVLLRRGGSFWDHLVSAGVDTTMYRVPANYPPPKVEGTGKYQCICGMGTPDLHGTYGEFTYYSPDVPFGGQSVSGGRFQRINMFDNRAEPKLIGPENFLLSSDAVGHTRNLELRFEVMRDPEDDVAKITIDDEVILLNEGEWSDWIPITFETGLPGSTVVEPLGLPTSMPAIVRLYLKQVHPDLHLYVTPLNIDPLNPVIPIGSEDDFPGEIADELGRFNTVGIPEDTKALRSGAMTEDEFLQQVQLLAQERTKQYRHALSRFESGVLFFYFGHTDQLAHIFWRDRDPDHPGYVPEEGAKYSSIITETYLEMDAIVGEAIEALNDDDTLIIMSDHGFASFRRGVNLNTWLHHNGYLVLEDNIEPGGVEYLAGVDWSRTRAYAIGLNALYINLKGREKHGIVAPGIEADALIKELADRLVQLRDIDGAEAIDTIYVTDDTYPKKDDEIAPDILVGYARNYRGSWKTAEGAMGDDVFEDNLNRWSGDHCIAAHLVPGVLVTNRTVIIDDPDLTDLAPTLLGEYGLPVPEEMTGEDLFERVQ